MYPYSVCPTQPQGLPGSLALPQERGTPEQKPPLGYPLSYSAEGAWDESRGAGGSGKLQKGHLGLHDPCTPRGGPRPQGPNSPLPGQGAPTDRSWQLR